MTHQEENTQVLNYILNKLFFTTCTTVDKEFNEGGLELYITPECNLKCKYCYLVNYGDKLYPSNIRDHNTILTNLDDLLNYLCSRKVFFPVIHIFSGEIWSSEFGYNILSVLIKYIKLYKLCNIIAIPSNMSFIMNNEALANMLQFKTEFALEDVRLMFSASFDGKIVDDISRPRKNGDKYTDEFYSKLIELHNTELFGLHPMVSSSNVQYWKENWEWFVDNFSRNEDKYSFPVAMMLEVRNDDWTDESIEQLCNFLEYMIMRISEDGGNLDRLYKYLQALPLDYTNIKLVPSGANIFCLLQSNLTVRLGDLAIVPCHRLSYPNNIYGYFVKNNNGELNIQAKNVELASYIYTVNPNKGYPSCDTCKYARLCNKGCLGAQRESSGDLAMPAPTVCKMLKSKIRTLIAVYDRIGFTHYLLTNYSQEPSISLLLDAMDEVRRVIANEQSK